MKAFGSNWKIFRHASHDSCHCVEFRDRSANSRNNASNYCKTWAKLAAQSLLKQLVGVSAPYDLSVNA